MTPEERQEIRERHQPDRLGDSHGRRWCSRCFLESEDGSFNEPWPCDTARLLADYDHLVEERDELAEFVSEPLVPKADYDHLVEMAREATDRITKTGERPARRGGYVEHLVDEVHTPDDPGCVICALRALIDPATPEPVEGEPHADR